MDLRKLSRLRIVPIQHLSRNTLNKNKLCYPVPAIRDSLNEPSLIVEIAGLRNAFNISLPKWFRLFWFVVFLSATVICIYQSTKIIKQAFEDASTVNTRYISNQSIIFPSVVLCPYEEHHPIPILNVCTLQEQLNNNSYSVTNATFSLSGGQLTLHQLWNLSKLRIKDISVITSDDKQEKLSSSKRQTFDISNISTPLGMCLKMTLKASLKYQGSRTSVQLKLGPRLALTGIMVALHEDNNLSIEKYFYYQSGMQIPHVMLLSMQYFIRITQVNSRNTRTRPCTDNALVTMCLARCLERVIAAKAYPKPCRLPYMDHTNETDCASWKELQAMVLLTFNVTQEFSRNDCLCPQPCQKVFYTLEFSREGVYDENIFSLEIYIPDHRIEVMYENAAYTLYSAFSDLGGCLSLWLGLCLLTILQVLTSCFLKLRSKLRAKMIEVNPVLHFRQRVPGNITFKCHNEFAKTWKRRFFLVFTAGAMLGCAYQCSERILHYTADPISVDTFYKQNTSILFPSLTICPERNDSLIPALNDFLIREKFGKDFSYKNVTLLLSNGSVNIDHLWNLAQIKLSWQPKAEEGWRIGIVHTVLGICISVRQINIIKYKGLPTTLALLLGIKGRDLLYRIIIHADEDLPHVKYQVMELGFTTWEASQTVITFRITEMISLNLRHRPCEKNHRVVRCLVECIENKIKIALGLCRLPYMMFSSSTPLCKTNDGMVIVLNATRTALSKFQVNNCNCPSKCKEVIYTTESVDGENLNLRGGFVTKLQIRDNRMIVMKERHSYTLSDLLSDIGGTLGLFTGLCVLHVFEILATVVSKITIQYKKLLLFQRNKRTVLPHHARHTVSEDISSVIGSRITFDLPGFQLVVKNHELLWVRITLLLIFLAAIVACFHQCMTRVKHYVSDPSEVNTLYMYNKTIKFPLLLICMDISDSVFPAIHRREVIYSEYWNMSHIQLHVYELYLNDVVIQKENYVFDDAVDVSQVPTASGICILITTRRPVMYNGYQTTLKGYIFHTYLESSVWMALYSADDLPLVRYMSVVNTIMNDVAYFREARVTAQVKELIHRNTSRNHCTNGDNAGRCVVDWIENRIYSNSTIKCRLPYMQASNTFPTCSTQEEHDDVRKATMRVLKDTNTEDSPCPKKCRTIMYILNEVQTYQLGLNTVRFQLTFPENRITVVQEIPGYSLVMLLSDLGGSLGLFFGIGLVQLLEIFASVISRIIRGNV